MIGTLRTVVLDAPDIRRLAAFYIALGGWAEQDADDDWITMETGDGWRLAAQRSPDLVPPRWPDPAYPQQAHLDLRVPDLDAGLAKAAGRGAASEFPAGHRVPRAAVARSRVSAAVPSRRHGRRRRYGRGRGAEARCHLAVLRRGELAGLHRPGQQALLPLLGLVRKFSTH